MDTIKNWGKILSLLFYIAALVMYFTNPDVGIGHHWMFWLSQGLIALSLYYSERRTHTALWSSLYLAVIAGMWFIPIPLWWGAFPVLFIGCYNARIFLDKDGTPLAIIVALISCYFLYTSHIKQQQEAYIKNHEPKTVLLNFLHVNEDGEITTGWTGQMPIRFHRCLNVNLAEININKSTKVIVMDNEIIWYEQI